MTSPAQQKAFSRDFFDRQDPTEGIGELIIPFSFSSIYDEVNTDNKLSEICTELYDKVLEKLNSGDLGKDIHVNVIEYKDANQGGKESPRKYLAITRETRRKTRITIFARFLPYGNKLYVGVDSFVLGNINWLKVVGAVIATLLPFVCYPLTFLPAAIRSMAASLNPFGGGGYQSDSFGQTFLLILQYTCCCIFPWLILAVMFLWLNTIRNFRHEGNLLLGLRQGFNQILNTRSFNIDDILMTLKSVLPLVLGSVREVFERHNLPVKSLDEFAATIQNINNIQNVYGSGNAVAGAGGKASTGRSK